MGMRRPIVACMILVLAALMAKCTTADQGRALLDTEWVLVSLNGDALVEGRTITLSFGGTSLDGSGGCNTYGGSYAVSEEHLRLSELYWTEMACVEPRGLMEQEQAYFQALNAVTSFRLSGERLELYAESEAPILVFVTAGGPSPS